MSITLPYLTLPVTGSMEDWNLGWLLCMHLAWVTKDFSTTRSLRGRKWKAGYVDLLHSCGYSCFLKFLCPKIKKKKRKEKRRCFSLNTDSYQADQKLSGCYSILEKPWRRRIVFRDSHLVWVEPGHADQFTTLPQQQMLRAIKHTTDQETIKVRDKINH